MNVLRSINDMIAKYCEECETIPHCAIREILIATMNVCKNLDIHFETRLEAARDCYRDEVELEDASN